MFLLYSERICYKTTIDQCGSEYRIHLNLRNEAGLQRQCPQESEELRTAMAVGSERYFQSPRYGSAVWLQEGAIVTDVLH